MNLFSSLTINVFKGFCRNLQSHGSSCIKYVQLDNGSSIGLWNGCGKKEISIVFTNAIIVLLYGILLSKQLLNFGLTCTSLFFHLLYLRRIFHQDWNTLKHPKNSIVPSYLLHRNFPSLYHPQN